MTIQAEHFLWEQDGDLGLVTLNRPERKNPLTFESYAELRDTFRVLVGDGSVRAIVISGQGGSRGVRPDRKHSKSRNRNHRRSPCIAL